MVDVEGVRRLVGALFADAEEPEHGALTVGAGNPAVRRSELELGRLGCRLHGVIFGAPFSARGFTSFAVRIERRMSFADQIIPSSRGRNSDSSGQ